MNETSTSNLPDIEDQDLYNLFRQQIVAEDNLVNHRMTWLLLFQGFLLAILAGVLSQTAHTHLGDLDPFKWLICIVGIIGSVLIGIGIWAAQKAIDSLVEKYSKVYETLSRPIPDNLPPLVGGEIPNFLGKWPLFLPAICVGAWIIVGSQLH